MYAWDTAAAFGAAAVDGWQPDGDARVLNVNVPNAGRRDHGVRQAALAPYGEFWVALGERPRAT